MPAWLTLRVALSGVAGAVLLGLLTWEGLTVRHWRSEAARVPQLEQTIKDREATIAEERRQAKVITEASNGYQAELTRLRNQPPSPVGPVRLCRPVGQARVPLPAAGAGPDAAAGAGGGLPQADDRGPDIGPALYGIADDADTCSAQVRGLQDFVRRMASPTP